MRKTTYVAAISALSLALAGCTGGSDDSPSAPTGGSAETDIAGDITVLTWRTDLVDTVFQDYKATFEAKYPEVTVNFEAITDYEGEVAIRLNTDDYGDVLGIPASVSRDQLPQFFEPLGTVDELGTEYRYVDEQSFEGNVYGLAVVGNANGILYNKAIFEAAGITDLPTSPAEFIDDLQKVKDNTDAIPYYTNYKDGWPLGQYSGNRAMMGSSDYSNTIAHMDSPWAETEFYGIVDRMVWDITAAGLIEEDPLTTNWEESKNLIGTGKIATMMLGSWAIIQMQDAAEAAGASRDDIGYMPFPYQSGGNYYSTSGGDYKQGINIHSENKAAARAWIDWFNNESGFAESQGGIPTVLAADLPASLSAFQELGVELLPNTPPPAGEESLESDIYTAAEIDIWGDVYRKELIDGARGASGVSKDEFFNDLNARWAAARASVSG